MSEFDKIGMYYKQFLATTPDQVQLRRRLMDLVNQEFDLLPPHLKARFLLIESIVHTQAHMATMSRKQWMADAKTPGTRTRRLFDEFRRRSAAYSRLTSHPAPAAASSVTSPPARSPTIHKKKNGKKTPPPPQATTTGSTNLKNFEWSLMGSVPLPSLDSNFDFEGPVRRSSPSVTMTTKKDKASGKKERVRSATPPKSSPLDLSRILDDLIEQQEVTSKRKRR